MMMSRDVKALSAKRDVHGASEKGAVGNVAIFQDPDGNDSCWENAKRLTSCSVGTRLAVAPRIMPRARSPAHFIVGPARARRHESEHHQSAT